MDLLPDENASLKHAKSVMRWDAKKKRYMVKEVDATGREVKAKKFDDAKKKKPNFYANWQKSSHKRIQEVGEQEDASLSVRGKKRKWVEEDDTGADDSSVAEPSVSSKRKPIVPFHGTVETKYLTNKQKRQMARRKKSETNAVTKSDRRTKQEVKPLAKVAKEKRAKDERRIMSGGVTARRRLTDRKKTEFKNRVQTKIDKKSGRGYSRSFSIADASSKKGKKKKR